MRRRAFIAGLGSAAAWPVVARAQQGERLRQVGLLMNVRADDPDGRYHMAAFTQELQRLNWTDGRNVRIDVRWTGGDAELFRKYAPIWLRYSLIDTGETGGGHWCGVTADFVSVTFCAILPPSSAFLIEPGKNSTGRRLFSPELPQ
jgi:putative tryptophan/tyrosine transport system substrate-binding protein